MLIKTLTFISTAVVATTAFGYSVNPVEIKINQSNFVLANQEARSTKQISLLLKVNTKKTDLPVVLEANQNKDCVHKQTLIKFSGFNGNSRLFVREYEIQIQNSSNRFRTTCEFLIFTDKDTQYQQKAEARIVF